MYNISYQQSGISYHSHTDRSQESPGAPPAPARRYARAFSVLYPTATMFAWIASSVAADVTPCAM